MLVFQVELNLGSPLFDKFLTHIIIFQLSIFIICRETPCVFFMGYIISLLYLVELAAPILTQ